MIIPEIYIKKVTGELVSPSSCNTVAIMLDLVELGEKPSHGGTNISLLHWTGTRFRLSFSHHTDPRDHHLINKPVSEKATNPCRKKKERKGNRKFHFRLTVKQYKDIYELQETVTTLT